MKFSQKCEIIYGTQDLYHILNIPVTSSQNEVKEAYFRLSLSNHPFNANREDEYIGNERFNVLSKAYSVLSDPEKRTFYNDGSGLTEVDNDDEFESKDWVQYWEETFSPTSFSQIKQHEFNYVGSEQELDDLVLAYLHVEGDMSRIIQFVPFAKTTCEDRLRARLRKLIDMDAIPAYEKFFMAKKIMPIEKKHKDKDNTVQAECKAMRNLEREGKLKEKKGNLEKEREEKEKKEKEEKQKKGKKKDKGETEKKGETKEKEDFGESARAKLLANQKTFEEYWANFEKTYSRPRAMDLPRKDSNTKKDDKL